MTLFSQKFRFSSNYNSTYETCNIHDVVFDWVSAVNGERQRNFFLLCFTTKLVLFWSASFLWHWFFSANFSLLKNK